MRRPGPLALGTVLLVSAAGCSWQTERAAFLRGVTAYQQGRYDAALVAYGDGLELAPRSADLHVNRGAARLASGSLAEAIADFNRALVLDPAHAGAAWNRGLARAHAGDPLGARLDWNYAVAVEGDPATRDWMRQVAARWPLDSAVAQDAATRATPGAALVGAVPGGPAGAPGAGPVVVTSSSSAYPTALPAALGVPPAAPPDTGAARPGASAVVAQRPLPAPGTPPPVAAAPPGPALERAAPAPAGEGSPTWLTARGVQRALAGDRRGALADLRAALARETDPARRERMGLILLSAAGPTPDLVTACTGQASAAARARAVAAPPAGAAPAPADGPLPAAPGADLPFSDRELLGQVDPALREHPGARQAFLACMRQHGF
jgi:tetratricopeptide (TPR) repeat protein